MKKVFGFVLFLLLVAGSIYAFKMDSANVSQEAAIKQAQEFRYDGVCGQALTPAVHKETGARYTFNTTCLAPGWEAE